jgi:crotonobetainyl-CoA:carnitine CoA-transferase CaiB-like acyl-CoA transferase
MATGPLAGIRVLELSQIVAGPFAGIVLSDLGADVIKVEPPEGENRRNSGAVVPNEGKYFQSLNRGKRSLTIDLSMPEGRALIHRIIPNFDVVLLNYRAGVAERLDIDYATLSKLKPSLVYANITGFGATGPYVERAGSDIVAQAYSGIMASEGKVDEYGAPQSLQSATYIDRTTGLAAVTAICAALLHREKTGHGQEVHVSLLHTALELLADRVMREPVHDAVGRDPLIAEIHAKRDSGAPYDEIVAVRKAQGPRFASHRLYYGGYHTKKGALVLGAVTFRTRDTIRGILGFHDPTDQPDFNAADPENRRLMEEWREQIQAKLMEREAEEWAATFLAAGVPASVVNNPEDMADDVQVLAAGMMVELDHAITGPQRVVGPIIEMSATPTATQRPAPPLAAHTREVLRECGLSDEEVDSFVASKVVTAAD